jgi:glycosyltransferase involved in cell wall biosynthesis
MISIDVVVPCYRYGHYLRECVQSVLAQGIPNTRVLVIDDASPDHTAEVASALREEDARVHLIRHASNKGHIATYNEGIDWASAKYVLLLSADDYLLPGSLARAIDLMEFDHDVGLAFGNAEALSDDGNSRLLELHIERNRMAPHVILQGTDFIRLCAKHRASNIVPTPTAVVRTRLQKQYGGYIPNLPHSADLEMWLRLATHSSVAFVRATQAVYRRHTTNMSLGYSNENRLLDLTQRKSALDFFLQGARETLPEAAELHALLCRCLAQDAVGHAISALNAGRSEMSAQLGDFAVSIDPTVGHSARWLLLAVERRFGLGLSKSLRSVLTWARQASLRLRS